MRARRRARARALALEKPALIALVAGLTARDMTGCGTNMDVSARFGPAGSANESIDAHSTPKSATTSPALASGTSCISSECMRTMRGTLTILPVRRLSSGVPRLIVPSYTRMYVSWPYLPSSSLNASASAGLVGAPSSRTFASPAARSSA